MHTTIERTQFFTVFGAAYVEEHHGLRHSLYSTEEEGAFRRATGAAASVLSGIFAAGALAAAGWTDTALAGAI